MSELVHRAQQTAHGEGHDYVAGSPHLRHRSLRTQVEDSLVAMVRAVRRPGGPPPRVLEIGAGHGPFTHVLLGAGAHVTVTEMSLPSVQLLQDRYGDHPQLHIVHDPDASWAATATERFDAIACISVLHHVPDYLTAIRQWTDLTVPGGAFLTWQDPLLYSRLARTQRLAAQVSYYGWRLGQGDLGSGLATVRRRLRGELDESLAQDMSEYHVVRDGVDEEAIGALLRERFDDVRLTAYWSTQSAVMQRVGEALRLRSEFAAVARGRR